MQAGCPCTVVATAVLAVLAVGFAHLEPMLMLPAVWTTGIECAVQHLGHIRHNSTNQRDRQAADRRMQGRASTFLART